MKEESKIQQLQGQLLKLEKSFNWNEIPDNLVIVLKEAISANNDLNALYSSINFLGEQRSIFYKKNFRYIKYACVDSRRKYTPFYNLIRKIYDDSFPNVNSQTDLWQIVDLAIYQIEYDLYCAFRSETDLFWYEKLTEIFATSNDYYYEHLAEFLRLMGLVQNIDDYYLIGVVENDYGDGSECPQPYNFDNEQLFICRKSIPEYRITYNKAWENFSDDLIDQVSLKMKDIAQLLNSKYTEKELFEFLEIAKLYDNSHRVDASLKQVYENWYLFLMRDIS